jgi:hypothetical protein
MRTTWTRTLRNRPTTIPARLVFLLLLLLGLLLSML